MKKTLLACAMAAMPMLSMASVPNLVVNGSFEVTPQPVSSGDWTIFTSITGWAATNGIEVRNNSYGTAYDGQNFVELDANSNSAMSQLISTTAGMAYDLSFSYSPRVNTGNTNDIQVFWGTQLLDTLTGTNDTSSHQWTQHTFSVMGHGQDTLSFAAAGTSDSLGGSLDAVSLSPVPEPETYTMLLAGLGLIGFIARRRHIE